MTPLPELARLVLKGYHAGIFPMADEYGKLGFYSADPRAVLPLDDFHCPRRLARVVRQGRFQIHVNRALERVIRGCAARSTTWISEEIVEVYLELGRQGHVHSLEAWQGDQLCGGLYGVAVGGAFCGESMYRTVDEASKVCVVHLVERLKERGFLLLDCQQLTDHMKRFGSRAISNAEYMRQLRRALGRSCRFD